MDDLIPLPDALFAEDIRDLVGPVVEFFPRDLRALAAGRYTLDEGNVVGYILPFLASISPICM